MMIVLLVTKERTVKSVDLEIFHKEKNVLKNVNLDIGKIKKNALNVKDIVPNVETVEIAKNVLVEESYIEEIAVLLAQVDIIVQVMFVEEEDSVLHGFHINGKTKSPIISKMEE